jgi:subtilisin family serine protease
LAGVATGSPWPASGFAVGVVDSGVDASHPDLQNRTVGECSSALTGAGTLVPGCSDDHGHGTHVSGTIVATGNNGVGIVGVAPNARVFMCKALAADGNGWTTDVAACINEIVAKRTTYGIKVISLSLGGGASSTLELAVRHAQSNGVLVVAAAGNDGTTIVRYPAGYDSVVSVAAIDRNDAKASFSNTNSKVEVAAPGVAIVSTVPEAIVSGGYGVWSGTSMATPHVAAVAALISWKTGKVGQALRDALDIATDDVGPAGRDEMTGYGRINLCKALGGCGAVVGTTPPPSATPSPTPSPSPTPTASPTPVPVQKGKLAGTGYVRRTPASGVTVRYKGAVIGSVSTRGGKYSVDLPPGSYDVTAGYRGVSCRAGSSSGPSSTQVAIVSGATKTVNWYC